MEIQLTQLIEAYSRIARVNHYHIFIIAVFLDIVSGYAKALFTKDLDSKVGLKGIVKHICIVLLVFITCPYLWLLNKAPVAMFLLYSIVVTYVISIIENFDAISPGTLPKGISQFFRRTKDSMDKMDLDDFIKKEDK
ncbi:MAG: phage holin family protein [Anaerococcus vaginalis]|uniref:phage holin family protein n=1 Tax=Anaerococcus vaginalis TaxID=33037 RepID=UPI0029007524|nr:phage holin family protein [Anaerococcus vaginalis]MDU1764222.1 phage holin family protein [Anaerococcus vaginalis]